MSQEQVEELKEYSGCGNTGLGTVYLLAVRRPVRRFGTSLLYRRPVAQVVGERFLSSLWLMASAWVLSGVFGLILGILAGAFKGKWPDRLITGYCMVTASTPSFWIGLVLLSTFFRPSGAVSHRPGRSHWNGGRTGDHCRPDFPRLSPGADPEPDGNFQHCPAHQGKNGGHYGKPLCALCQGQRRESRCKSW